MPELHETLMGKRFFEGQFPKLVKAAEDIAAQLERANDLKERELALRERELEQKK